MTGICTIRHSHGWAISNDCIFNSDKFLIEVDGQKVSKSVLTIKINHIFDAKGVIETGSKVECLFKADDDSKLVFAGVVKSRGKQLTVIDELQKLDTKFYNEILTKIKTWQTQQPYPATL